MAQNTDADDGPTAGVPGGDTPRGRLGRAGEALAAEWLEERGHQVIARNWRIADGALRGELDLVTIAPDGRVAIIEVKTRRSATAFGGPLMAVTVDKQRRIRRLGVAFVRSSGLRRPLRFDVVGISWTRSGPPVVDHRPGAF